jgi:hypothetical protein
MLEFPHPSDPESTIPPGHSVYLDRARSVSPTLLNRYRECPFRVRLQYIENIPEPKQDEHNLTQGRIAHDLLRFGALSLKRGAPLPTENTIFQMANKRVYPDPDLREETRLDYVRQIVRWVQAGFTYLDVDAEYLLVEQPWRRPYRQGDPLKMTFRPDIVMLRGDRDGQYVEVIDYKTGRVRPESDVPVIARFVLNDFLQEIEPRPWEMRVVFRYVWLDHAESTRYDLDPTFCSDPWRTITGTIERLFAEREWHPTPSFHCKWCPYNGNACVSFDPGIHSDN